MKITCDREQLLSAFQKAAMVAPARSPKSILQNVKLEIHDHGGILMATDMEIGIRIHVEGIEIESGGEAVFPVTHFGSILRESSDEKLRVEADSQGIKVYGQRSEFNLPSANPDEFPSVVSFEEERYHKIPARLLRELARRTLFATDTESSRYALGGVLLEMEADKIVAIGTDGRRLAKMEGPAESEGGHETGEKMTIVPARAMLLMERTVVEGDSEVLLTARENDVVVKMANATIYARLIEGRFPKWRDVFPVRQNAVRIDMTVGPTYSAWRQAAVATNDDSRGIDCIFGEGKLALAGSAADVGQSHVEMPIGYDGDPITLTMDHRFVADFLKVLDTEKTFAVEIENQESAAVFSTDDGYAYVVMPLSRER